MNRINIDGTEYMPVSECIAEVITNDYVIVRTHSAGVFAGYLKSRVGKEVVLTDARRLWQWYGAASLSQLAMEGTSDPKNCKFPCTVQKITLTEAIEIIPTTLAAKESIIAVPVWSV